MGIKITLLLVGTTLSEMQMQKIYVAANPLLLEARLIVKACESIILS